MYISLFFLFWFIIACIFQNDADKRDMKGLFWGTIVFFLPIIGIIIYLLVRKPLNKENKSLLSDKKGIK